MTSSEFDGERCAIAGVRSASEGESGEAMSECEGDLAGNEGSIGRNDGGAEDAVAVGVGKNFDEAIRRTRNDAGREIL